MAVLISSTGHARSFGEHGGYDVAARESASLKDRGFCIMREEFEGPGDTRLDLIRKVDDPEFIYVALSNYNWSAKKNAEYPDFEYRFNDSFYERTVFGLEDGIHKGFLAAFPYSDFMPTFAKSKSLHVYRKETVVDKLTLAGSAAAKAAFERCWTYLVADDQAKQREWNRWNHIPRDPFSTPTDRTNERNRLVASVITADDYPSTALAAGEQGVVGFRATINTSGRVTACDITSSSGSAVLDATTCRLVRIRARFDPVKDQDGTPITDTYDGRVKWSLPAPSPAPATPG
jgi:TonB family protein